MSDRYNWEKHICKDSQVVGSEQNDFDKWFYGDAIREVLFDPKSRVWFAHNDEYASQIHFCPWCGLGLEPPTTTETT